MGAAAAAAIAAAGSIAGGLLADDGSPSKNISGFAALPEKVRYALKDAIEKSQADYARGPQQYFPGQTYANLTPEQLAGLQSQLGFAQNQLPQQLGQINQSFGGALNAGSIYGDPSVQAGLDTIENRANRNFAESVLPRLRQQATGTGNQYSSKAEQSERLAGRDLQQAVSDSQSRFLADQLGSARALQGSAIGNAPNISQLGLLPGQTQFGVGQAFQNQNQLGITEDINRFNFGQQAQDENINTLIARLTGLAGAGGGAGFNYAPGSGTSTLSGALGGALIGNSLYNTYKTPNEPQFTSPSSSYLNNVYQSPNTGFLTDTNFSTP